MRILVVNAGSSSIKVAVFEGAEPVVRAALTEIGGAGVLSLGGRRQDVAAADHDAAMRLILDALGGAGVGIAGLDVAAHRIVHGGQAFSAPCRITPEVRAGIEACVPLAPLHNPANLAALDALARIAPDLPHYASFDTAFHATNPEVALRYAIPAAEDARGIRRYGFHGISYASLTARLPDLTGAPLPGRLLALHLGNGASLCAIRDGRSVATTMGYSPLDGLTMGTRAGAIDGNAVLRLAELHGIEGAARLLNRDSGLKALGGASDMRALAQADTPEAAFARAHFAYWAVRHAGSMIAAMGGIDAMAFTGGIGENDAGIRADILDRLGFFGIAADLAANQRGDLRISDTASRVPVWIVPAAEEAWIAAEAMTVIAGEGRP